MSDLALTLSYLASDKQIVDSEGNLVAERERRPGFWGAFVVSQTIVDATGQPLFKVVCRTSRTTGRVDVLTPYDEPISHIKGTAFFGRPREFTIRDGSGLVIGRILGTHFGPEYRLLDNEDRLRARGVRTGRKEGREWSVEIQGGQPLASPWPELTAAYFLSRRTLGAPKSPP